MTHTTRPADKRATSPPTQRSWWRSPWLIVGLATLVVLVVAVVAVAVWPDEEPTEDSAVTTTALATTTVPATTEAPVSPTAPAAPTPIEPGTLAWAAASSPPRGQVLAAAASDTGYLAASHTDDGVSFWVSDTGDRWTMLVENPEAFLPDYQVYVLHSGPGGFSAEAFDPNRDYGMGSNSVFVSLDGAAWYRTDLSGDLPDSPSPYVIQHTVVHGVLIGPSGFLAFGSGSLMPNLDLIASEYAPGYSSEDVWAVDAEMRRDGGVLIVGFGDDEPLEIPFSELGIEAEDVAGIIEGEGEGPTIARFLWSSTDGETWELVTPEGLPEGWLWSFMLASVGADDGFYVFSADPEPNDPDGPAVMNGYHSTDGRVWTQFALEGPDEGWMQTVDYGNGLFVAVGDHEGERAVWTSTDARVWERVPGSEALFAGLDGTYEVEEIDIGGAGYVAVGHVWPPEEMFPTEPVEPVVVKEGYVVTFGEEAITIENETTGELEVFDMQAGSSESFELRDGESGLTFVESATGADLFVITNDEIEAAWNDLAEEIGAMGQPPAQLFRYSTDLVTWTLQPVDAVFGEDAFAVAGDMDDDTVIAVVATDMQRWDEETDRTRLPPTVIWVATPGS